MLQEPIQCLRFATTLENVFRFFAKFSKYGLNCYFFENSYCKYDIKKPTHILSLTILRF